MLYPVLIVATLLPAAATAQQTAVKVPALTAEERSYLAEESALVRKLRLAELRSKISDAEGKGAMAAGDLAAGIQLPPISMPAPMVGGLPADTPAIAPEKLAAASQAFPYKAVSVWGTHPLRADIASSEGGTFRVTVMEGQALPGGWLVSKVEASSVVLTKGKAKKILMVGG